MRTLLRSAGRRFPQLTMFASLLLLTACVTINVYFPAAEAQEAAKEFVDKVIGEDGAPAAPAPEEKKNPAAPPVAMAVPGLGLMSMFIGEAHAAADISIRTPAIQAILSRMEARFDGTLRAHFDSGALGFTADGLVTVRDATKIGLKDRVAVNNAVAEDNRDRKAVYREMAVASGHEEWEDDIRDTFAKQWVDSAKSGWWYQNSAGAWKQK
jgi:uncharacterized protein YdbL (DUF1318 family)